MYQSGQRRIVDFDVSPLQLNLDFLNGDAVNLKQNGKDRPAKENNEPEVMPDYNYLME